MRGFLCAQTHLIPSKATKNAASITHQRQGARQVVLVEEQHRQPRPVVDAAPQRGQRAMKCVALEVERGHGGDATHVRRQLPRGLHTTPVALPVPARTHRRQQTRMGYIAHICNIWAAWVKFN